MTYKSNIAKITAASTTSGVTAMAMTTFIRTGFFYRA